jgi:hypothetical protein
LIVRLIEKFHIDNRLRVVCRKYAGVSEAFSTVQKEEDERELDETEKKELESRHPLPEGYA